MHYQPQISTISPTAPPSYSEAVSQPSTSKNSFPLPPFGQQSYGTNVNVQQGTLGQYPTTIPNNYMEYNSPQSPYNPLYVPIETNQVQSVPQSCVVTTAVVARKDKNATCSSCVKMLLFSILIICIMSYLLKLIISSILD
ncbi:uncharacterized protein LOC122636246 isoform X1 [Vespula pensylvanica]|uniref:uncharacterized protein LOC122636246 isoform X1 n=2 Tax=Vespula pensylvanica TaxID=30213 RepID=UPI001CB9E0EC|nr:uncharacterized protein LOC122636246 isoform X1 [Vespula pensylvanica]